MDHLARAQRMLELQEAENARVSTGFSLIRAWSSSELLWPHPSCWLWQHKQTQRLAEDCRIYFKCVFFDAQWMHIRIQCKHCNPDVPSSLHLISLKSIIHFFLLTVALFIHHDCFGVSCRAFETTVVEMSAFSPIWWNKMTLSLLCSKHQEDKHWKNSPTIRPSRNHDLATQENPQTLLWAV